MCGLVAIFNRNNTSIPGEILIKVSNSIQHRGPDDEGFMLWNDGNFSIYGGRDTAETVNHSDIEYCPDNTLDDSDEYSHELMFLHRRLAIVDLSEAGHQPLSDESGRYWLIYNGEIYNYLELREELESFGYSFKTNSDTEVLLKSYIHWGEDCSNKFNGMWSAIIFDSQDKSYWISRDRLGVKPLYVFQDENFIIFCSEIKSLLPMSNTGLINLNPNKKVVQDNIIFNVSTSSLSTEFEGITRFPAASYAKFSINSYDVAKTKLYWEYPQINEGLDEKYDHHKAVKLSKEYYALLKDAVSIRLRGEVSVGSALSGGLDSSSLVYLVNQIRKESGMSNSQHTFSNIYSGELKFLDESENIKKLADYLDVISHLNTPLVSNFKNDYPARIFHRERSSLEASLQGAATYSMPRKNDVTITLDGQGADEQLAGYSGYWRNLVYSLPISTFISIRKNKVLNLKEHIGLIFARIFIPKRAFNLIFSYLKKRKLDKFRKCLSIGDISLDKFEEKLNLPRDYTLHSSLENSVVHGLKTLLWEDDIDGMQYSVESRQPFVDYRLIEFLAKVPYCYKLHNGYSKYIARLAFDNKLPDDIVWDKDKKGFPGPVEYWINNNTLGIRDWANERIENHHAFFKVRNREDIDYIRNEDISLYIRLLVTSLWYECYFGDNISC